MTIGQRLREAREARGLGVEDVVQRTYIQSKFIRAIESDDLDSVPGSHLRFFVRAYAEAVELDPEPLVEDLPDYEPPSVGPAVELAPNERVTRPERRSMLERYREGLPRLPYKRGVPLSGSNTVAGLMGIALLLVVLVAAWYFFLRDGGSQSAGVAANDTTGSATEIISRPGHQPGPDSAAAEIAPGDSLTLEGRAVAKVWYSILIDDKRSETGLLDSGMVRRWRAGSQFQLTLGNAGGLQLTLGDRSLGTLGRMGMTVRNQLITANGLKGP